MRIAQNISHGVFVDRLYYLLKVRGDQIMVKQNMWKVFSNYGGN